MHSSAVGRPGRDEDIAAVNARVARAKALRDTLYANHPTTHPENATMTSKDYELIARAICTARDLARDLSESDLTLALVIEALTEELQHTNPKFSRERFIRACYPPEPRR